MAPASNRQKTPRLETGELVTSDPNQQSACQQGGQTKTVARSREPHRNYGRHAPYCLGEKRVAALALLTFTALSG